MPSATKFAGSSSNGTIVGKPNWNSIGNIFADDFGYANCSVTPADATSQYLYAATFGFTSGDIPSGSTINGIKVTMEIGQASPYSAEPVTFANVELIVPSGGVLPPTVSPSNLAAGNIPPGLQVRNFGGTTELWGFTPTQADVTDSEFGVALIVANGDAADTFVCLLNYITITVYYAEAYSTEMFPHDFDNVRTPFVRRPFALGS